MLIGERFQGDEKFVRWAIIRLDFLKVYPW